MVLPAQSCHACRDSSWEVGSQTRRANQNISKLVGIYEVGIFAGGVRDNQPVISKSSLGHFREPLRSLYEMISSSGLSDVCERVGRIEIAARVRSNRDMQLFRRNISLWTAALIACGSYDVSESSFFVCGIWTRNLSNGHSTRGLLMAYQEKLVFPTWLVES